MKNLLIIIFFLTILKSYSQTTTNNIQLTISKAVNQKDPQTEKNYIFNSYFFRNKEQFKYFKQFLVNF